MRVPMNSFDADDKVLCRAHGLAVATPRQAPAVRGAVHGMCAAMADCGKRAVAPPADLPLPPSYWDDLEYWLKTLAPAKPAASQPEPAIKVGARIRIRHGISCEYYHTGDKGTVVGIDENFDTLVRFDESSGAKKGSDWFVGRHELRLVEADKPAETAAPAGAAA